MILSASGLNSTQNPFTCHCQYIDQENEGQNWLVTEDRMCQAETAGFARLVLIVCCVKEKQNDSHTKRPQE